MPPSRTVLALAALTAWLQAAHGGSVCDAAAIRAWCDARGCNATHCGPCCGKAASHVPSLSLDLDGTRGTITVAHATSASHFIDAMYALDQRGDRVHFHGPESAPFLAEADGASSSSSSSSPSSSFDVPPATATLTAFEHCNLHGVWRSPPRRTHSVLKAG